MGREKEFSKEQKLSSESVVEMQDIEGNKVRVPLRRTVNPSEPLQDIDGVVPEFVNVSGQVQLMTVQNDAMHTVRVDPWGILRGSQWRSFSEPAPAWGSTPRFIERRKRVDGSFDPLYLLDEEQVISEVKRLRNCDPDQTAYERLDGFQENGKVKVFDKAGRLQVGKYAEDRPAVVTILSQQLTALKKRWDVVKKDQGITD